MKKRWGRLVGAETTHEQSAAAEMERMMKIQEVILKAMAEKLKWWEAAEIIGVTDRTLRRSALSGLAGFRARKKVRS